MKLNQNCKICDSTECFLFENSTTEFHEELNNKKTCVKYKKGQQIIREGEVVAGMYFIKTGKVKVHRETDYRGQIVRFAKGGDILGHRGLGGENIYPISATALDDSLICFVEHDMLFTLMKHNSILSIKMMMFYANELKNTERRLSNMAIMTVRERIAEALLLVHDVFGVKNGIGTVLDVGLSRKDIAEIAGTYPEQASRYITEFKDDKILDLEGKTIILKKPNELIKMLEKYGVN
jgi:CRP/FNR family transcriptional regulator